MGWGEEDNCVYHADLAKIFPFPAYPSLFSFLTRHGIECTIFWLLFPGLLFINNTLGTTMNHMVC